ADHMVTGAFTGIVRLPVGFDHDTPPLPLRETAASFRNVDRQCASVKRLYRRSVGVGIVGDPPEREVPAAFVAGRLLDLELSFAQPMVSPLAGFVDAKPAQAFFTSDDHRIEIALRRRPVPADREGMDHPKVLVVSDLALPRLRV